MINNLKNIGIVIQARMGSSRLFGKVLKKINNKELLKYIIDQLVVFKNKYKIVITTSNKKKDDVIEEFCKKNNILCFRGSEDDVLDRYYMTAKKFKLKHIIRFTGDNILIDIENFKNLIQEHFNNNADYSSNKLEVNSGLPIGVGMEIFTFNALEKSWQKGKEDHHREHVNEYILENPVKFKILKVKGVGKNLKICKDLILTIDTKKDFQFMQNIVLLLSKKKLKFNLENIIFLKKHNYI